MKKGENVSQLKEDLPLVLDSYEDIFSYFDPRPYSQRALSEEFLSECKKASDDKNKVNLQLFLPKIKRNLKDEIKIKRRLKEHFKKHTNRRKDEIRKIKIDGLVWFLLGSVTIVAAAFFLKYEGPFWFNLLITLAHPAGWFFMWEGLTKWLITTKEKMPDYKFYKKMANSEIAFFTK